jgi:hypothetical protein
MTRLMPNPLGDLERSLEGLNKELEALRLLPEIREQLIEVNANLRTMCEALGAMDPDALATARTESAAQRAKRAA